MSQDNPVPVARPIVVHDGPDRTGRELPVRAPHAGHTVIVKGRHPELSQAWLLECSCGTMATIGGYWLEDALGRGYLRHDAIAAPGGEG